MGVDSLMTQLANGWIIFSYTPMRKIPNFFHNACLNSEIRHESEVYGVNSAKF